MLLLHLVSVLHVKIQGLFHCGTRRLKILVKGKDLYKDVLVSFLCLKICSHWYGGYNGGPLK